MFVFFLCEVFLYFFWHNHYQCMYYVCQLLAIDLSYLLSLLCSSASMTVLVWYE